MKDSFLTIGYRGFYINLCNNRETHTEEIYAFGVKRGFRYEKHFKTLLGAKRWITKMVSN